MKASTPQRIAKSIPIVQSIIDTSTPVATLTVVFMAMYLLMLSANREKWGMLEEGLSRTL